ncbi:hypothetical protein JCGZ_15546 [Jatropha curcas]|uniref:Uncharacterized protein n=1 Tax=Jatropha curcas TaxID=180498 RepID=A0A067K6V8_JATCU|nr:hypothetical protein JCGZ_15546 [Jatropha curcas]
MEEDLGEDREGKVKEEDKGEDGEGKVKEEDKGEDGEGKVKEEDKGEDGEGKVNGIFGFWFGPTRLDFLNATTRFSRMSHLDLTETTGLPPIGMEKKIENGKTMRGLVK